MLVIDHLDILAVFNILLNITTIIMLAIHMSKRSKVIQRTRVDVHPTD